MSENQIKVMNLMQSKKNMFFAFFLSYIPFGYFYLGFGQGLIAYIVVASICFITSAISPVIGSVFIVLFPGLFGVFVAKQINDKIDEEIEMISKEAV